MSDRERKPPASLVNDWPEGETSDEIAETARRFVVNLRGAIGDRSIRSVAKVAGLDEGTIRRVLAGTVWPDLRTIAALEHSLGVRLYPQFN